MDVGENSVLQFAWISERYTTKIQRVFQINKQIELAHIQSRNLFLGETKDHEYKCNKKCLVHYKYASSCDRFVCDSLNTFKAHAKDTSSKKTFKLAWLYVATYRLSNRKLHFQISMPICCCPTNCISDQGQPFLNIFNSAARVDYFDKNVKVMESTEALS